MEIIIKKDYQGMCQEAVTLIHKSWQNKKNLVLGLATGKTPLGVYQGLIDLYREERMDFSEVSAFSLDEYLGLHKDHPQSFAFYMQQNFFQHINIKKKNIFRLNGLPQNVEAHCDEYEKKIRMRGGIDIQILGIGGNGHIGFNEPSSSLSSRTRIKTLTQETIAANAPLFRDKKEIPRYCLTMGIGTILESRMILLLASGQHKSQAIQQSVEGPITASIPASVLQLHVKAKFIIDDDAAARLQRKDYYRWVYEHKDNANDFLADKRKK
ncbi:MAG: glucosamine-6-phosphate deaminase [Candidatus Aminicenantes bacterium]|jgi:glucosamine-6-phosphate deaminase